MEKNRYNPLMNMRKKVVFFTLLAWVLALSLWGVYIGFQKFLKDRQGTANFTPPKTTIRRQTPQGTQVQRYTPEELEKARKEGTLPPGLKQPPPPTNHANDAVQRSLKTIQEINRINEMNRRLMEQQQRMQNQQK